MDDLDWNGIAQRITAARRSGPLTAVQLGEAIGRSKGFMGNYERGQRRPSLAELHEIARVTNCDPRWLIFGDSYQEPLLYLAARIDRLEAMLSTVPGVSAPPELPPELADVVVEQEIGRARQPKRKRGSDSGADDAVSTG